MTTCPPPAPDAAAGAPLLLVTRPAAQAAAWVEDLRAAGIRAAALPLIGIAEATDPQPVFEAWRALAAQRFVMFVSANAVEQFFALRPDDAAWPPGLRAGATGPGTARALREAGLDEPAIVVPQAAGAAAPRWDSEGLWARIAGEDWAGRLVLVVRGEKGRDWLAEQWQQRGARVGFVEAYRRELPRWSAEQHALCARALAGPDRHAWLFSSSEAVANLQQLAPPATSWRSSQAWATHERIADAARRAGFGSVQLAGGDRERVVAALREHLRDGSSQDPSVQSALDS